MPLAICDLNLSNQNIKISEDEPWSERENLGIHRVVSLHEGGGYVFLHFVSKTKGKQNSYLITPPF